jgi:deoxyribodipyrimidine photo-lyase
VGEPWQVALEVGREAALLVTDGGYLRHEREWRRKLAREAEVAVIQIETNTVVPVTIASRKQEYAARTIRPKLTQLLDQFCNGLPSHSITSVPAKPAKKVSIDRDGLGTAVKDIPFKAFDLSKWRSLIRELNIDQSVGPVSEGPVSEGNASAGPHTAEGPVSEGNASAGPHTAEGPASEGSLPTYLHGGESKAKQKLYYFLREKLIEYDSRRNDPGDRVQSGLSPYLHFGQISPIDVILQTREYRAQQEAEDAFLEELFVRRELSFNFVYYNPQYDSYDGLPQWARNTLEEHARDKRPYLYTREQFEEAATHDRYWNAATTEMKITGGMHNYMRMYWGKKILEWSATPREAFATTLYLNNKYCLDGRDPNSFAGVAWCFGNHDRPWKEREIFGKVRYMNARGLERKFNMEAYLQRVKELSLTKPYM